MGGLNDYARGLVQVANPMLRVHAFIVGYESLLRLLKGRVSSLVPAPVVAPYNFMIEFSTL